MLSLVLVEYDSVRCCDWCCSGYPVMRLALQGQHWDWLAHCQYTVTLWFERWQFLSQCGSTYNCLSRAVHEIHYHVAGMSSNQLTTTETLVLPLSAEEKKNHLVFCRNSGPLCFCVHLWVLGRPATPPSPPPSSLTSSPRRCVHAC